MHIVVHAVNVDGVIGLTIVQTSAEFCEAVDVMTPKFVSLCFTFVCLFPWQKSPVHNSALQIFEEVEIQDKNIATTTEIWDFWKTAKEP